MSSVSQVAYLNGRSQRRHEMALSEVAISMAMSHPNMVRNAVT
jgi:hypothetical protein